MEGKKKVVWLVGLTKGRTAVTGGVAQSFEKCKRPQLGKYEHVFLHKLAYDLKSM